MKLVYAAPVPYSSFAQRAHHFVAFCNRSTGGSTLWINPYPGRLPRFADLRRARTQAHAHRDEAVELLSPPAWVADPMGCAPCLRQLAWKPLLRRVAAFVEGAPWSLVIGRPSRLALELLRSTQPQASCYDAMDDFPRFYQGRARSLSRGVEDQIARRVDALVVSSRSLQDKFSRYGLVAELVRNGLDAQQLPAPRRRQGMRILGYIGTIGAWFDWSLVAQMARALPQWRFDLIGPEMVPPDVPLPTNVRRLGECANAEAFSRLQDFSAGLIPFKINGLTAAVDPIKYYEYRAAGLPVIATKFGEIGGRGRNQGVYLVDPNTNFPALLRAVEERPPDSCEALRQFRAENAWSARFAQSGSVRKLLGASDATARD